MKRPKNWRQWIPRSNEALRDLLMLVSYQVPLLVIAAWTLEQKADAYKWAMKVHLRAGDNIVHVPPKPAFLKGYEEKDAFAPGGSLSLLLPSSGGDITPETLIAGYARNQSRRP